MASGGGVAATLGLAAAAESKPESKRHAESIAPTTIIAIRGGLVMHSCSCPRTSANNSIALSAPVESERSCRTPGQKGADICCHMLDGIIRAGARARAGVHDQ